MKRMFWSIWVSARIVLINIISSIMVHSGDLKECADIKILVLIIASDDLPVYRGLQEVWRSYMHLDPQHFECYFIRGNPLLDNATETIHDTIWCRTEEGVIPGIINKTILAIEAMIPRIEEFDYLLRTNLSSFYVFPRLLEFVRSLPKTECYAGCLGEQGAPFASGSGFLLSRDLVRLLLANKQEMYNNTSSYDDVLVGQLLHGLQINVIDAPRKDILNGRQRKDQEVRMDDGFHFRVKNDDPYLREATDVPIQRWLRNCFYP